MKSILNKEFLIEECMKQSEALEKETMRDRIIEARGRHVCEGCCMRGGCNRRYEGGSRVKNKKRVPSIVSCFNMGHWYVPERSISVGTKFAVQKRTS